MNNQARLAAGIGRAKYTEAQKQKVKGMLRDAIRVLCQNTIIHNAKLSIDALIGITIDNGDDILLVSIQENIGKYETTTATPAASGSAATTQSATSTIGSETYDAYHDEGQWAADGEDDQQYYEERDDVAAGGYGESSQFGETIVKEEMTTSVVTYKPAGRSCMDGSAPRSSVGTGGAVKTENYYSTDDGQYYGDDSSYYGQQSVDGYGMPYDQMGYDPVAMTTPQKVGGTAVPKRRPALQKNRGGRISASPRATPHKRSTMPNAAGKVKMFKMEDGGGDGWQNGSICSAGDDGTGVGIPEEVTHITLYTCQKCGAQMKSRNSFMRHKKIHEGIVYRCDACGKVVSRSDHLTAHKRKCPAFLAQQEQMQD